MLVSMDETLLYKPDPGGPGGPGGPTFPGEPEKNIETKILRKLQL